MRFTPSNGDPAFDIPATTKVGEVFTNPENGRKYQLTEIAATSVGTAGVAATVAEKAAGNATVGSNLKIYASGWRGNQYVSTAKIAEAAELAGRAAFVAGTAIDIARAARGEQSKEKAATNITVGVYGLLGGEIPAAGYFLIDTFYPGGIPGYLHDIQPVMHQQDRLIQQNQQLQGPGWRINDPVGM